MHPRVPVRRPGDSAVRRAGKGGCADGQGGGSGERDECGANARARVARAFAVGVLGPVHPCGDVAVLLANRELSGNSAQHSGSGDPGETVTITITVRAGDGLVWVEVTDRSGPGVPEVRPAEGDAEDGRGLGLVAGLAARWGWRRRGGRTVTWFCRTAGPGTRLACTCG